MPTPRTEVGRAAARAYYASHKGEHGIAVRRWQRENREKHLADRRAWYAKNSEPGKAKCRAWRKRQPDNAGRLRRWRQANTEKVAVALQRRHVLQLASPGRGVSVADWRSMLAASLGLCAYCNERKKLTMDHIDPLASGGEHDPDNTAAACKSCNSSKRDTPLVLWLVRRFAP